MTLDTLAMALQAKTAQHKLIWTMNGVSQVTLKEGHNLIEINEIVPNNSFQMLVRNKDGMVLDSGFFNAGTPVGDIFLVAKRKSLRVDEELSEIMRRIESR